MKNAIIVHGVYESREEFLDQKYTEINGWKEWLQFELNHKDIPTQMPQMPKRYIGGMNFDEWVNVFKQFVISSDTILIGHSAGGGFLLKYLSLHPEIHFKQLVLVAPWIDKERYAGDFFNFKLDSELKDRLNKFDLFYSTDDDDYILESVKDICDVYKNIKIHKSDNNGHFDGDMYKEILEVIEK
ncbi:MAG: hypothetical protein JW974_02565 [Alphaproteobacteria bacterium]|nr:hypothetical protein [Alphaproteobacteria bacterium]MBN2675180.1 hypothetical protein [Alphaproteobacteria bacterium]